MPVKLIERIAKFRAKESQGAEPKSPTKKRQAVPEDVPRASRVARNVSPRIEIDTSRLIGSRLTKRSSKSRFRIAAPTAPAGTLRGEFLTGAQARVDLHYFGLLVTDERPPWPLPPR